MHPGARSDGASSPSRADAAPPGPRGCDGTHYVAALDGVRAFAILGVLAFHGGVLGLSGGFLGVDAFFVLSGYLITSLLLAEHQRTGRIDLPAFWGRRARRLLPALMLVLVTAAATAPALLPDDDARLIRGDGLAALFYVANWRMISRGEDYFSRTAAPSPLEHTWSLGIEEQFYLCWPVLLGVLLVTRRPGRHVLTACLLGAAVSTAALALLHHPADPGRAYYGTDTRAASLLVGAVLATWLASRHRSVQVAARHPRVLGVTATGAIVVLAALWAEATGATTALYRGGLLLHAVAMAVVLADVALVPEGLLGRCLSLTPLVLLGRISYGVYLWHWPLFLAVNAERTGRTGIALFAIRCTVTLALAVASYLLLERPVRTGLRIRRRLGAVALGTVAVGGCAVLLATSSGASTTAVAPPTPQRDGLDQVPPATGPATPASAADPTARPPGPHRPRHHWRPGRPLLVDVFGDSVAWSLVAYLPHHPGLDIRDRTSLGCGITTASPYRYFGQTYPSVMAKCRAWEARWRTAIRADDPDVAVILVGRWETMDRVLHGRWVHLGDPAYDAHLRTQLQRAISITGSRGATVLVATEPFNRRGEQPDGTLFPEDDPSRVIHWNRLLLSVAASHPRVRVLDFGARVSPQGRYSATVGGVRLRADGLHLTPAGVRTWIAPWLFPRLLEAAPR